MSWSGTSWGSSDWPDPGPGPQPEPSGTLRFEELYLRNFLWDFGQVAERHLADGNCLAFQIDTFVFDPAAGLSFDTSRYPNTNNFTPFVYVNKILKYLSIDYSLNAQTVTFVDGLLVAGDTIEIRYFYEVQT
jgi:hypothetical protein